MAEKEEGAGEPSRNTNPFLLSSTTTFGTQPSTVPKLFGTTTTHGSTVSKNLFPVSSSLASNPFSGTPIKSFETKSASKLPEESGKGNQGFSSNVFGGPLTGGESQKLFSNTNDSKSFVSSGAQLPAYSFDSKKGSSGFSELPENKSLFSPAVQEKTDSTSSPAGSIFGGVSYTSSSKSSKSDVSAPKNVFGEAPRFQSAVSRHSGSSGVFVTSGSQSFSKSMLFGGSTGVTSMSSRSVAPVFSVSSASVASQSSYSTAAMPNLFGGKSERSKGFATEASSNIFGGASFSTTCFTSVSSSSVPRLFGGIPSNTLASGRTPENNTSPLMSSNIPVQPTSAADGTSSFISTSASTATNSVSASSSADTLFPSVFGGKPADKENSITASTALPKSSTLDKSSKVGSLSAPFPVFSDTQKPQISEQPAASIVFPLNGSSKSSVDSANHTSSATTLFGGTVCTEPGEIVEETIQEDKSAEDQTPQVDPESQLEPGEIPEDNQGGKSLFGDQASEPISELRDKELKAILSEDLMNILGKDDGKHPLTSPTSSGSQMCDKKELTKIIIAQIPDSCMDKDILRNHFQKFGTVKRVYLNQKSNQATVQYADHKGASKAKRKGQKIHPNLPEVKIFYAAPARRKSEESSNDAMISKKKAIKTLQHSHPTIDLKVPSDINPYTPLERPSRVDGPPSFLSKSAKEESKRSEHKKSWPKDSSRLAGRITSKASPIPMIKASSLKVPSPKMSPSPLLKTGIPKVPSPRVSPSPLQKIGSSRTLSPKGSPSALLKAGSSKITRIGSPKPAQLKIEEERNKSGRAVSPAKDYSTSTDTKSLKAALEMEAQNSSDRYNVLKVRDKLMRNDRKKRLDINKATKLDAKCPDMCPELERYMRDIQNDLSSYEVTNGILDHNLVIKKFSRSSADKEEPLPHELRPGPVLLRTMDFLVCNIIGLCDREGIDIGIWYNYLWDRTRAIRSDITQQQLTDDTAVTIIERCVRFHIYTAVHLCEESPDVFDRKLNTENLTKSLQTLKELYKDLAEVGKYFKSESEFRAYEMLLNLNDGEKIVHQYSQYRDEIQKSPDVIFALKVFLALKSNNFVKFFKLMRNGTYLQGCISHRYIPQVRSKALDIFVKSYIVSKQVTIPLSYIIKTLGFEDKTDATTYLNYHGIVVDEKDVIIDRNLVDLHPEGQPPITRPVKLIESNRLFSVAEVIQGGPIPENPLHSYVPHDSFNERGYLNPDAKDASDQLKKLETLLSENRQPSPIKIEEPSVLPAFEQSADVAEETDIPPLQQPHKKEVLSDHEYMAFIKDTYDIITTNIVSLLSQEIAKDTIAVIAKERSENAAAKSVTHDLLSEYVKREARVLAVEAYDEVGIEEKERKKKEYEEAQRKLKAEEKICHNIALSLSKEYLFAEINSVLKRLCQDAICEVKVEVQKQVHDSIIKEFPPKLISEVIREEVNELGVEVISELKEEQERKIEKLLKKIHLRKLKEYFLKWRKVVFRARRQKQAQETFPASFSQLSLEEQNEVLPWGYDRKLSENVSAKSLMERELNFTKIAEKLIVKDQLESAIAWYPLPLQKNIEQTIDKPSCRGNLFRKFFKILLCTSENSSSLILQWLRAKLSEAENAPIEECLNYVFSSQSKITGQEFGVVLREVFLHSLTAEDMRGTSAIIFVTSDFTLQNSDNKSIENLISMHKDLPCKVICERKAMGADCWELKEDDILATETSQKLMDLVLDLWNTHSERIHIASSCLNDFVSGFVATHYVRTSFLKHQERMDDGKSPLSPDAFINLYNAVIQKLIEIVDDNIHLKLDWPPPELSHLHQVPPQSWNTDAKSASDVINQLKIPTLIIKEFMTWKEIGRTLHLYVNEVSHPGDFNIVLWSHVDSLLHSKLKMLKMVYEVDFEKHDIEIHTLLLPWPNLVHACISFKLSNLTNTLVFYQPEKLKSFVCPREWWFSCDHSKPLSQDKYVLNLRKRKAEDEMCSKKPKTPLLSSELLLDIAREKEKHLEFLEKLEMTLEGHETMTIVSESEKEMSEPLNSVEDLGYKGEVIAYSDLLSDIEKEKENHEAFQKKLESLLEEGEDLRFLFTE